MRTSRMLEMIYLLLEKRQMTSKELAEHFNVSTKTIYRDVEDLAKVGIPILMQQGVNGGIVLSDEYALNKTKLSNLETDSLLNALADLKRLPNAKLDYALGMLKQYFNESGTMWVNTNDVSLGIHDKFHQVKVAIIECNVIEFDYYTGKDFAKYHVEPYELRIKDDIWSVIVRNIRLNKFEELYLARMKDIEVKSKQFARREIPEEFIGKYVGKTRLVSFEVLELSDEILNRFPIENIQFIDDKVYLNLEIREIRDLDRIVSNYSNLKLIEKNTNKKTPI